MPTYEYKCDACGNAFEEFQSITAAPIKKCPKCGKNKVRRLIGTGAGMIFKGSGFYITDYRDQSYTDKAKAESGGGESKSESKSDAKSDGKTEAAPAKSDAKPAAAEAKPAPAAAPKAESKPAAKSSSAKKK